MSAPLDELYFKWLYSQVASPRLRNPERLYWSLARILYTTEFDWFVPNDDNRAEDGRDLRLEFRQTLRNPSVMDDEWLGLPCSIFEMLIGISRRLAFESGFEGEASAWFWILIDNLDLRRFNDSAYKNSDLGEVVYILQRLSNRTYDYDGRGGLFPLSYPEEDQRHVELWYQLNAYLLERE